MLELACGELAPATSAIVESFHHQMTSNARPQFEGPLNQSEPAPPPIPSAALQNAAPWNPVDLTNPVKMGPGKMEQDLAAELESVLKREPMVRVPSPSAHGEDPMSNLESTQPPTHRHSGDIADDFSDDFEWQQHDVNGAPDPSQSGGQAASLRWIAKARSDKRRRLMRNAAGWAVSLLVGGIILGGAAYFLTGWKPDISALLALSQLIHS